MKNYLNSYFKNEYRMSAVDFFLIEAGQKKILNTSIAKNDILNATVKRKSLIKIKKKLI